MKKIKKVIVLTGAGISQESGLATFRDANGLWEGHRPEDVATPEAFENDPELVHRFYNERRLALKTVEPNLAHTALAEFEEKFSGDFLIITQNVDDLHERAGSKNILHMHGELKKIRCVATGDTFDWEGETNTQTVHPNKQDLIGTLRPDIVWFGEIPKYMDQIYHELIDCDLFVAIGTSGLVYPAAGLVGFTPQSCQKIEINLENTPVSPAFDEKIQGKASIEVPKYFEALLN